MGRRLAEGIFIGIISGLILKALDKYGGIQMIKSLYQTFVVEMWPVWIGLIIAIIYWFIRFLIRFRKKYIHYNVFVKQTEDDWKKTQKGLLDAWQKISGFDNQIEQLTKVIIPSLTEKVDNIRKEMQGNADNAFKNYQFTLTMISKFKETLDEEVNRIIDERVAKEKQEATWEEQRQQRKLAGIQDWEKWPKKDE